MDTCTVIYDDRCPLCVNMMEWMGKKLDLTGCAFVPCDSPERRERFPLITSERCRAAILLISGDGGIFEGDRAIEEVLRRGKKWGSLSLLWKVPLLSKFYPSLYRWVSVKRYRISSLLFPPAKG